MKKRHRAHFLKPKIMIIAVALITTCSIFLSIILHALFFGNGDIEDAEMTKEELIEWIKKLDL